MPLTKSMSCWSGECGSCININKWLNYTVAISQRASILEIKAFIAVLASASITTHPVASAMEAP